MRCASAPSRSKATGGLCVLTYMRLILQFGCGQFCFGAPCRPYNVGSDQAVSILDLAAAVASLPPQPLAVRHGPRSAASGLPPRYVPSVERARRELGLEVRVPLEAALRRTFNWHQQQTVLAN